MAPQTRADGVKIDPISMIVVMIAAMNGQTEFSGTGSRKSGSASMPVETMISLRSTRSPVPYGRPPGFSQSGVRPVTQMGWEKFHDGGGERVAHSSVDASQGLSGAVTGRRSARITLPMKSRKLSA